MKNILIIFILISTSMAASAESLWVRHDILTGENDGRSYDNAWQGFGDLVWGAGDGEIGPGDTLYVCGGPHDQMLTVRESGNETAGYITITGDCASFNPAFKNGIMGRVAEENVTFYSGQSLSLYNDRFIIIENLKFQNPFGVRRKRIEFARKIVKYGKHEGEDNSAVLVDETPRMRWKINQWVGGVVFNTTQQKRGTITASTATIITATMSENSKWNKGDVYRFLDDSGSIALGEQTNNIIIRNNDFDLTRRDIGFAIYFQAENERSVIHHVEILGNRFIGGNDASIVMYQTGDPIGTYHNVRVANNTAIDQYVFFHSFTWRHKQIDPDGDGSNDLDFRPANVDIDDNFISIRNGGWKAISFSGLSGEKNYIRNNIIKNIGYQIGTTNTLQLSWVRNMEVVNNIITIPSLKTKCDSAAIIVDWAYVGQGLDLAAKYLSNNITISENTIYGGHGICTGKAISVYRGRDIVIENNFITTGKNQIGIKVASYKPGSTHNVTIKNNTIRPDGLLDSIQLKWGVKNISIKNNSVIYRR